MKSNKAFSRFVSKQLKALTAAELALMGKLIATELLNRKVDEELVSAALSGDEFLNSLGGLRDIAIFADGAASKVPAKPGKLANIAKRHFLVTATDVIVLRGAAKIESLRRSNCVVKTFSELTPTEKVMALKRCD